MSVSSVISNTWHCDRISCPTGDIVAEGNPFHRIEFSKPAIPQHEHLIIDLCSVCIMVVASQAPLVADWVDGLPPTEEG